MEIQTKYGKLEGVAKNGYIVYRGIPYAKPPVGGLRWKEPQEPDCWEGTYRADTFGSICPQAFPEKDDPYTGRYYKEFYSDPAYIPPMSEDCLYLNIWTPEEAAGQRLPVAFWVHGGGFGGGYSSEVEFDGEEFCKKGVILVTVNYRLSIFGFLAHPWLNAENEQGISGNYGMLDQIAALRWVYENIEAFGGDPQNITVFGQSAGSMSTQILISSDLTGHMISKAILQSGLCCERGFADTPTLKEAEGIGGQFAGLAGANSIDELRGLSVDELMEAKRRLDAETWKLGKGIVVVPNVDGYLLKASVAEIYRQGGMKQIPYMAGCVTNDLGTKPEELKKNDPGDILKECRDFSIRCSEVTGYPSYVYHFGRELPGDDWGAFHSSELWYVFGTLGKCWRPMEEADYAVSRKMITCWSNFMKCGNPNGTGDGAWLPCTKEQPYVMRF